MSKKMYHGSCHCKKVQFTAEIDFSKSAGGRCNCTYCTKERNWSVIIKPEEFKLKTPHTALSDYTKGAPLKWEKDEQIAAYTNHHLFCKHCGIHSFGFGNIPEIGGNYASVTISCLDDVDFKEVMSAPVNYMNGKDNDWFNVPAFTKHL